MRPCFPALTELNEKHHDKEGKMMLETIMNEAERYDFPIIPVSDNGVARNSAAKRRRSLSHVSTLSCLNKKTRERVLLLNESSAVALATKRGAALVCRRLGCTVFMYLPMLESVVHFPNEDFSLDASARDLSELWSNLAAILFPNREINAQSCARISSVAATLCFSENVVKTDIENDGIIDAEKAFCAIGQALSELDFKDATELSDPPINVKFSSDKFSVHLYGEEIYSERTAVLAAVEAYFFTEKEYSAAFALAAATAIFKARK